MSQNPLNLALRFLLEMAILAALGYWGWTQHSGVARWTLAILVPLVGAIAWAVFRVPGDGGPPVVAVPGWTRLLLEATLFVGATLALRDAGATRMALMFAGVSLLHYALSWDRVASLLAGAAR